MVLIVENKVKDILRNVWLVWHLYVVSINTILRIKLLIEHCFLFDLFVYLIGEVGHYIININYNNVYTHYICVYIYQKQLREAQVIFENKSSSIDSLNMYVRCSVNNFFPAVILHFWVPLSSFIFLIALYVPLFMKSLMKQMQLAHG